MISMNLEHPFNVHGQEVSTIHIKRPKLKDILVSEKAGDSASEKELYLIASLCSMAPQELHQMDVADYRKCQEVLEGFFS